MRYWELLADSRPSTAAPAGERDRLALPSIDIGDEILFGKFKNRRAVVKGLATDRHNQPVLRTSKGEQKLFKFRLSKLLNRLG